MSPEKLVYMANQIGRFFAHEAEPKAIADTSDHLKKFWDPRMRRAIIDYVEKGGEGLTPITRQAVLALAPNASLPPAPSTHTAGAVDPAIR